MNTNIPQWKIKNKQFLTLHELIHNENKHSYEWGRQESRVTQSYNTQYYNIVGDSTSTPMNGVDKTVELHNPIIHSTIT